MSHHNSKRQEQTKLIEKLTKKHNCHFKKHEIEKLISMYGELASSPSKKLDRVKFRDLLHQHFDMTDDILLDRVFRAFDQDSDNYISPEEWVTGLSTFINDQSVLDDNVIKFCFIVYDLNGDGYISREEMFQLLKNSIVKQQSDEDSDENIKELVELILKKMDHDHDSRLSLSDFTTSVKQEPLLLEAFGKCLPSQKKKSCFRTLICKDK